jgi:ATP/maltotriose-dependent transcriptional regulator MalT
VLALIELQGGDYDSRADALISAAELQSLRTVGPNPGAGIICLAKSRAALAAGEHERALELALETAKTSHVMAFQVLGYLDAASINCEQGRSTEGMRCVAAADRLLAQNVDVGRLLTKRRRAIDRQVQLGRAARGSSVNLLTEREMEVLRLLDSDLSRREIARELYLSFETVKTYVKRLYQKLGVSSRAAAVATAEAWGWMDETSVADEGDDVLVGETAESSGDAEEPEGDGSPESDSLPTAGSAVAATPGAVR